MNNFIEKFRNMSAAAGIETFLLFQLLFGFALASLSFLFGVSLGPWQYWTSVGVVLCAAPFRSWRTLFCLAGINALVLLLTVFTYSYVHVDSSICHLPATHFMVDGWNPVRDATFESVRRCFALAGMPDVKDFSVLHVLSVPKFSHILSAQVQSAFGLFTAMGYPLWTLLVSLALVSYRFAGEIWDAGRVFSCAFAVLACANFIVLENSFLGLVDYATYAGIAIAVFSLVLWKKDCGNRDLFAFFAAAAIVLCNKLNGLIPLFLVMLLACVWGWRTRQMRWGMAVFVLSLPVFCILPYWTAAWHYGSPLYPAHSFRSGVELVDLTADFIGNADAERMGYLSRMVYAWVSKPLALWGCRIWHGVSAFLPAWKWDFLSCGCHGAFCFLLWGGVLLSMFRKATAATVAGRVLLLAFLLMPVKYIGYARYVAYVYLVVLLLWVDDLAASRFMRRRMTILLSGIALVVFLMAGWLFAKQVFLEDSRRRNFDHLGKFGYDCVLDGDSAWWEYAFRSRMAVAGLMLAGPGERDVREIEVAWPFVFSVDGMNVERSFLSLIGFRDHAFEPVLKYKESRGENDE